MTEILDTLLAKSAPAVAPAAIPANLLLNAEVKLTSDCVSADNTPVTLFIVRLLPTFTPPRTESVALFRLKKFAPPSMLSSLLFNASVKLFCVSPPSPTEY